jgi:hypothetical protein
VVFDRALANGNLLLAEMTARELGWINLLDALQLLALLTVKDPRRGERAKHAGCAVTLRRIRRPGCARRRP